MRFLRWRLLTAVPVGILVGGCAVADRLAELPGMKEMIANEGTQPRRATAGVSSQRGQLPSGSNPSAFTSVVSDAQCERLVEPFELTDNVAALAMLSAEMGVGGSLQRAPSASKSVSLPGHVKRAAKNMNWMPIDWEKLYGQDLHQKRTDILNPANKAAARFYKQGNDMLKQVLAQISEPHPFEFKLYVSKETQANAEAFPGGYLYISKEALNRGAEYATFALAHEIGHVTKRHTTKEIQTRIVDSITTFDDLRKLMVARNASPATVLSYGRFLHGLFLNYSRDQETQADACAVHMMARIPGFDVRKATDAFLKALREDQHDGAGARGHVSTHPSYPERKQRIERLLAHYLNKASR